MNDAARKVIEEKIENLERLIQLREQSAKVYSLKMLEDEAEAEGARALVKALRDGLDASST